MEDVAALALRVTVGAIFVAHGWPKVFGDPEGRHGRDRLQGLFAARGLPYPRAAAWATGIAELVGGALVFIGLLTRVAAVPLAVIVAGAIPMAKWKAGFVDGWDWPFSVLGACVAILLLGPGAISLDRLIGVPF